MLELNYPIDSQAQQDVMTPKNLADRAVVVVHFRTPAIKGGQDASVAFADMAGNNSDFILMMLNNQSSGDFRTMWKASNPSQLTAGTESGSIHFTAAPDTDYYIWLQTVGPAPAGVKIKLHPGLEPTP